MAEGGIFYGINAQISARWGSFHTPSDASKNPVQVKFHSRAKLVPKIAESRFYVNFFIRVRVVQADFSNFSIAQSWQPYTKFKSRKREASKERVPRVTHFVS